MKYPSLIKPNTYQRTQVVGSIEYDRNKINSYLHYKCRSFHNERKRVIVIRFMVCFFVGILYMYFKL